MNRPTRRHVTVAVLATLLVATVVLAATATAGHTLVVTDADTGEALLETPVEDGETVTLEYTHSVEKTPVEDVYVVDGTALRMDRTVFRSHGAGLPSDADIERTDDGFVHETNDTYEELGVVPGSIAGHELVVGDERYDLVERADGPVDISVTDRSPIDRLSSDVFQLVPFQASTDGSNRPALLDSTQQLSLGPPLSATIDDRLS